MAKQQQKADDVGQAEVQKKVEAEQERGLHGTKVDPTPDEHYTVGGVTSGKPTPESDPDRAGLRREQHDITTLEPKEA
jgi:hypothetical protein